MNRTEMQGLLTLIISIGLLVHSLEGRPCRYWCKTHENHFYCCPSGHPEESEEKHSPWSSRSLWLHLIETIMHWHWEEHKEHHEKHNCPPIRSICPRKWESHPPELCHSDAACGSWEKCCYDICLDHKVCKPFE